MLNFQSFDRNRVNERENFDLCDSEKKMTTEVCRAPKICFDKILQGRNNIYFAISPHSVYNNIFSHPVILLMYAEIFQGVFVYLKRVL